MKHSKKIKVAPLVFLIIMLLLVVSVGIRSLPPLKTQEILS